MKPDVEYLVRQGPIEFNLRHEETGSYQLLTLSKNEHRFLTHTQSAGGLSEQTHVEQFQRGRDSTDTG